MSVPTAALRKARENAGINQGEMAKRLGVSSNSVVSRLEKAEVTDQLMAERYLKAIGTADSLDMLDFYSRDWKISKRPDFRHPNRDVLWAAEQALQDLEAFEAADEFDQLLTAPLNFTRDTLLATTGYVARTDHALAWIGAVGIGKTTALSHLTNLVHPDSAGRPRAIFPTSAGRTTTSEVVVRTAPAFSITVEPKSEDEIRLLVREFVDAVAGGKGVTSTEHGRVIRSMANLPKRKDPSDSKALLDPVEELLDGASGAREDVVHAIVTRMRLGQRTETQMFMSENNASGLQWLSAVVTDINFGRHPRVSIPDRVTVFVPKSVMRKSPYDLTIIDTKGILGATDRPDLQALTADPRALSILCCGFNDAPGQDPLSILKGLKEMGSDAVDRQRVALLVLPRGDEAIRVIDDLGEPVESVEEGYAYRSSQIQDSLRADSLPPVPVIYFNVADEGAGVVWQKISQQVDQIRRRQLERLQRFTDLAAELRTNADAHRIQQARVTLAKEAVAIANDYESIPGSISVAQKRLLQELKASHPSSIAAAALRNGSWYNLDVHHIVGTGVRADANLRTSELVSRIKGRLDGLQNRFASTPEAVALVETLAEDLSDWHQEFLIRAQSIGRNTFKPYLDDDVEFWADLRERYGQGAGYRDDIIAKVDKWFEGSALNPARAKVDARLADAWKELLLRKLVETTTLEEETAG